MAKIKVAEWIETGELDEKARTDDDILDSACNALDEAGTGEILGPVLFKATNGKYYTVTVEAIIAEAHKDFVKQTLADKKAEREG